MSDSIINLTEAKNALISQEEKDLQAIISSIQSTLANHEHYENHVFCRKTILFVDSNNA